MEIRITNHAHEKLKERTSYSPTRLKEIVEEAYYMGKDPEDFPKRSQKYLKNVLKRSNEEHGTDVIKVFKGDIFLFCKGCLITSFPVDKTDRSKKNDCRKNKKHF